MAEKLNMESSDLSQEHIRQIQQLFPNTVTEIKKDGKTTLGIDFDLLKQELSNELIDDRQERYQMTWPDKKKSMLLANSKINGTLRPLKEKSVNFDNTKNIYIEGDNLDVLKLLRETYINKVNLIYIDPPYNTGNDFIYDDNYSVSLSDYIEKNGSYDFEGNRLFVNSESDGRYHTNWLNMIYPRLKVSKDLLKPDGTIFISIGLSEPHNLRKVCDEIFGQNNFIMDFVWNSRKSVSNDAIVSLNHNYTLVYTKNMKEFLKKKKRFKLPDDGDGFSNPDNDPRGPWKADPFDSPGFRPNLTYTITNPNTGKKYLPPKGRCWRTGINEFNAFLSEGKIIFGKNGISGPQLKRFLSEATVKGITPKSLWDSCGTATDGTKEIIELFWSRVFDTPKPVSFIKQIIDLSTDKDALIMDFFAGSSTLAHAVMECNKEGGFRKYILIQLDENLDESLQNSNLDAKKIIENAIKVCDDLNKPHLLTTIGEERILRAGKKIKDELIEKNNNAGLNDDITDPDSLDIGFRVFKLDSSNMNDVYYNPNQTQKSILDATIDNIKPGRTGLDLLFQVMLELGVELSAKIEEKDILGKKSYFVNDNKIVACFDDDLTNDLLTELAKTNPTYAVFKDSCFSNDSVAINNEQIFKTYSPSTKVKVL